MRNWSHPCVLSLYDIVEPSLSTDFEDLYIVTPLLTTDLSKIIYSKTTLSDEQQLYLFYQTCCGVHYINSAGVLHRDLKPANLLVDVKTCSLKVCDFGLSRCLSLPDPGPMDSAMFTDDSVGEAPAVSDGGDFTEYVVTRWYRAPEVDRQGSLSGHTRLPCAGHFKQAPFVAWGRQMRDRDRQDAIRDDPASPPGGGRASRPGTSETGPQRDLRARAGVRRSPAGHARLPQVRRRDRRLVRRLHLSLIHI